jgi:S-adenosylmethionine hydrolase
MKGVILGIVPGARIVDVTHDVAPHDVAEGALALEAAVPCFPRGTVHVGVIDPGVGTARRGLVIACDGHILVGPDNGLFTPLLAGRRWRAFELGAAGYQRPVVSSTFHGRDLFAPAAAHVASGVAPDRLGTPVDDPVRLAWPEVRAPGPGGAVAGMVVHVDRFGNLVTSIHARALDGPGPMAARIAGRSLPLVRTYADLPAGGAGALIGSHDRLEVAVREGSAAALLRARRGTPILVSRSASPGRKRPGRG